MESTRPVHPVHATENDSTTKLPNRSRKVANFFKGGVSFGVLRGISNAIWIGGTAASIAAQEKLGVPWQVAAPAVGVSVASIEMYGSKVATRIFKGETNHQAPKEARSRIQRLKHSASYIVRESIGLGYSAWAGAMSAVEVNSVLKLESSQKRRTAQSTTYGVGVAAWSLPIAREPAINLWEYTLEHPVSGSAGLVAGSLALFAAMEGVKKAGPTVTSFVKERLGLSAAEQIASIEEPLIAGELPPYMIVSPQEAPIVES